MDDVLELLEENEYHSTYILYGVSHFCENVDKATR